MNEMGVRMVGFWFSLVLSIIGARADGIELTLLTVPESIWIGPPQPAPQNFLKEIYTSSLGLTTAATDSDWQTLGISNPFYTPEAAVQIFVDGGTPDPAHYSKQTEFELTGDDFEPEVFGYMEYRLKQRFPDGKNIIVEVNLIDFDIEDPEVKKVFGDIEVPKLETISSQYLNPSVKQDHDFLKELAVLKGITKQINSLVITGDSNIDFFNFRFVSLRSLIKRHGAQSTTTAEAKRLLGDEIQDLSEAFQFAYKGSVLVTLLTSETPDQADSDGYVKARRVVRDTATDEGVSETADESAERTSSDYPAIFNIILWFTVVFVFVLVAIVYALMDMDPGRDSIIYRMTSTRIKKDN